MSLFYLYEHVYILYIRNIRNAFVHILYIRNMSLFYLYEHVYILYIRNIRNAFVHILYIGTCLNASMI